MDPAQGQELYDDASRRAHAAAEAVRRAREAVAALDAALVPLGRWYDTSWIRDRDTAPHLPVSGEDEIWDLLTDRNTLRHELRCAGDGIRTRPATEADRGVLEELIRRPVDDWSPDRGGLVMEADLPGALGRESRIGAAWLTPGPADDDHPEVTVAIAPGWTGGGLGSDLLAAITDVAQAAGRAGVTATVADDRARRLCERLGFTDAGTDVMRLTF
ncbi:hypothetical protein CXF35_00315 [Corynebacterium bovis]|uniref:N-acetyltransferase domain-containing protein n=1 Tax=Corynebacterium bovis TaxID=36808 RepID=A0A3R8QJD3_9CORY|nr:GNAT family N-acetyltransferase [Corynebacterium bovis]RRO93180.1 hypothetical protein CXF40_01400 [Corynebacterium bovis]RRQ01880.1 hypothetical protein CXF41_02420 [Corynebacterium bovis]RRQ05129.1 hypothetical protein CXF39_00225 [Corynebacterium bovis]RRQ05691.1 hypothetical protein CXF42_00790 [Corynebacterium bovis]RRQ05803.1 hypothetical protein CXF34_10070 [Corynebacterium bovis]